MSHRITYWAIFSLLAAGTTARTAGAQRAARVPAADSAGIAAVLTDLDLAWQTGDAARWTAHYAPDVRFINVGGMLMADAGTLRTRMVEIFRGIFRNSRHVGTLRHLRRLGPDAVLAEEEIEIRGFSGLPPGIRATEPGVLRTRMRHVLQRVRGRWVIVASQNTAVAPFSAASAQDRTPAAALDSIVLERSACFGTCAAYRLSIAPNGSVLFQSRNRGDSARVERDSIAVTAVTWLRREADRQGVMDLPAVIAQDHALCPDRATDHPTVTVSIFDRGAEHIVSDYHGCFLSDDHSTAAPLTRLRHFETAIDSVARSARWIRPNRFR